jgi:hypothetical protein
MPFCQQCGSQASSTAHFCFNCGADVAATAIALPGLSPGWRSIFAALHKGGGVELPQSIELSLAERAMVLFNPWAFAFGPFYYIAKGMARKALTLCGLAALLVSAVQLLFGALGLHSLMASALVCFIPSALFATRANIDYFKKMVLDDDGWL